MIVPQPVAAVRLNELLGTTTHERNKTHIHPEKWQKAQHGAKEERSNKQPLRGKWTKRLKCEQAGEERHDAVQEEKDNSYSPRDADRGTA